MATPPPGPSDAQVLVQYRKVRQELDARELDPELDVMPTPLQLLEVYGRFLPRRYQGRMYACVPVIKGRSRPNLIKFVCPFCLTFNEQGRDTPTLHRYKIPMEHRLLYNLGPYAMCCAYKNWGTQRYAGFWLFCITNQDNDTLQDFIAKYFRQMPRKFMPRRELNIAPPLEFQIHNFTRGDRMGAGELTTPFAEDDELASQSVPPKKTSPGI